MFSAIAMVLLSVIHLTEYGFSPSYLPSSMRGTYDMAVVLISYHKTGHDLQMDLIKFIANEFPSIKLTEKKDKSIVRRRFLPGNSRCARIHLKSGAIAVQHAPDLYCSPENLAKILLEGGKHRKQFDKGT